MNMMLRFFLNKIRKTPKTTNSPTPTPTEIIRSCSSQPICPAITLRSGSATVTRTPMIKVIRMTRNSFFCLKSVSPTIVPTLDMYCSAPLLKKVKPSAIKKAQIKKQTSSDHSIIASFVIKGIIKTKVQTTTIIGRTQIKDSQNFFNQKMKALSLSLFFGFFGFCSRLFLFLGVGFSSLFLERSLRTSSLTGTM